MSGSTRSGGCRDGRAPTTRARSRRRRGALRPPTSAAARARPRRPPPRDARCAAPRRSGTARAGRRPASLLPLPVRLALLFECLRAFLGVLGLEDHRAPLALVLVRVAPAHAEPLPHALLRRLDRQRRVGGDAAGR